MHEQHDKLLAALSEAGHPPRELRAPNGSSILVLPYGARILGLFPANGANFLWVNPLLLKSDVAVDFFRAPGWRNTGGSRTWISPERDIHVADLDDPWNSYHVTESIDPGAYGVEVAGEEIRLTTTGNVIHCRNGRRCLVHLEKSFRLIPDPFHQHPQRGQILKEVSYAGVAQRISLRYVDPESSSSFPLSLWDAVNFPATGKVLIPTGKKIAPTDFFEVTGDSHLACTSNGVSFLFDGRERHKIAIRASDLICGRAGYLRQVADDQFSLVIRNFAFDPSAEYLDTSWQIPDDAGYVLECYNDGGINGDYGELEYHSPAMGPGTGRMECVDVAQMWGFQGSRRTILRIVNELLGSALAKDFLE